MDKFLPDPNRFKSVAKIEAKFLSTRLVSTNFAEIKNGIVDYSHRRTSLWIVFFEFVSIVRFLILFVTKKNSTIGYYLGDSLTVYGSIGKAIYFPYFCTAIGAVVMRLTLFFKESSGQLHILTDFSDLIRSNFKTDLSYFLAAQSLNLTWKNHGKLRTRIKWTYKSMIFWVYEVPTVVWLMTACLTAYSCIYIVPHGYGDAQSSANGSDSDQLEGDMSAIQALSAVGGLSFGKGLINLTTTAETSEGFGKHFFFTIGADDNWTLKIIIDSLWLIHSALFLFCFYSDVFVVTHAWYVAVYYLNLRLDQFNEAIRDLTDMNNLKKLMDDYYEIYFNRIKLYDVYSKYFICAVNFLANPITCCFIYVVVMKPIPIPGVKILFLIIATNSSLYSIFCTSQAATIHTKARESYSMLLSYQTLMALNPVYRGKIKLRMKLLRLIEDMGNDYYPISFYCLDLFPFTSSTVAEFVAASASFFMMFCDLARTFDS